MSQFAVIGIGHHQTPIDVRERLNFTRAQAADFLTALRQHDWLDEALLLSTCNRSELWVSVDSTEHLATLRNLIAVNRQVTPEQLAPYWYEYEGDLAIRHIFRVTSSLDALVVGESQILGQVKAAYAQARELQVLQHVLQRTLQRAFSVAKQVRSETDIARLPVSVSAIAVVLAEQIFGQLRGRRVVILGSGEMSALTADHLREAGVSELCVVSASGDHAEQFAQTYHAKLRPYTELEAALTHADILLTATRCTEPLVTVDLMNRVMVARRRAPLFCIDIAIPRNISEQVNAIDNVYLYNIDDLKRVADANQASRQAEAVKAEEMVILAVQKFVQELKLMQVVPAITSLHRKCEEIRQHEVQKTLQQMTAPSPAIQQALEACTQAIVAKILHQPVVNLKESHVETESSKTPALDFFRRLFGLEL